MAANVELRTDFVLRSEVLTAKTPNASPPRLLYLLSRYPGISHTFFLNEIQELRKHGFIVEAASINQPDRSRSSMPAAEIEETERTFYIKSAGAKRAAVVAARTLLLRPMVFVRGLRAALRMGQWDLRATLYALFYFAEDALARSSTSAHPLLRAGSDGWYASVHGMGIHILPDRAWPGRILRCGEVLSSPESRTGKIHPVHQQLLPQPTHAHCCS